MERFVWTDFECQVPFSQVQKALRLEEEEDLALVRPLFEQAKALARPKVVCKACAVDEIVEDRVVLDGVDFRSQVLARNLAGIHRVFAYVATCGREVDDWSHREPDVFLSLWLDMIKEMILRDAQNQFRKRLCEQYGLEKVSSMSPGSGNADVWPIAQQVPLFKLIGQVTEDTGVQLRESFLMIPTKSVSGVLFPKEIPFLSCMLCTRPNCIGRRAPYDPSQVPNAHA